VNAVRLQDQFWHPRLKTNRDVTLAAQYRLLEEKGYRDNFRRAAGKKDIAFQGTYSFNDTDVYKWLEAASWTLAITPDDTELKQWIDGVIAEIAEAQWSDGYVNTYFSVERSDLRWTNFDHHEMYCAGHLFQAAVAHYRATGSSSLLDVARRFADHLCDRFGEEEGKLRKLDAHPEVEMALVELYRVTGEPCYLEQAQFFLNSRGHGILGRPYKYFDPDYAQDNAPFRDLEEVTGHAVRMMYLDCGAADIYAETGDAALRSAMEKQWLNMTQRRMYLTGGIGARGDGEAFGIDYQLPSASAYAETCASIGNFMWNWRMLLATGDARFADLLERVLYNGLLAGVSQDGTHYFYENPLADDGTHRRQPWYECACCPPNIARVLAALPGYFASVSEKALWLHLYAASTGTAVLPDGETVAWRQTTDYPWDGEIEIEILNAPAAPIALYLRIPEWAGDASLQINDIPDDCELMSGTYAAVQRSWQSGDIVHLSLPMPVRRVVGHPKIVDTYGRVALMRGPLVYCVEQADHPEIDLTAVGLPPSTELQAMHRPEMLGGIVTLEGDALQRDFADWQHTLYRCAQEVHDCPQRHVPLTAIPYFAWANRTPGPMTVWIPVC
jgi:DUF1680 family protein